MLLDRANLDKWRWFEKAASRGCVSGLLKEFALPVTALSADRSVELNQAVFVIGKIFKNKVDITKRTVFGQACSEAGLAALACAFFDAQLTGAKQAVSAWLILARRFGVVKDIRRVIGILIWDARAEGNYKFDF